MKNTADIFSPNDAGEGMSFTLRDLVSILFKHRRIILACWAVVSVLVVMGMLRLPSTYIAEGKLLIKTEQQGNPSIFSGIAAYREPHESDPVNRKLETEMELLATRELSERVVRKLDLQYDQVYHKPLTVLLRPLGDLLDWVKVSIFGYPEDPDTYGFKGTVKEFNASFAVQPLKSKSAETTSNVIQVALRAPTADISQRALQMLLDEYVLMTVEQNERLARDAYALVEQNLRLAAKDLENAREQQRKFIGERGASLASRYSGPMMPETTGGSVDSPSVNSVQTSIGAMRSRLTQMELRLLELRQLYTDDNENIRLIEASMHALKQRIENELKATADSEKTLAGIDLEVKAAEQQYVDLRRKLDQIALFIKLSPAQAYNRQIAEPPLRPKSSEWKKSLLVTILGSIGGLMLGLGFAGYREYSDHRLNSAEAIEAHLGLRTLAVIGQLDASELSAATPADARGRAV